MPPATLTRFACLRQAMQEAFNSRTAWTFSVPCAMKSIKLLENKAQLSLQRCQRSSLCLGSLRCIVVDGIARIESHKSTKAQPSHVRL